MSIAGIASRVRGAFTGARKVVVTVFLILAAASARAADSESATLASHRLPADGRPGRDSPVNTGEFRCRGGFR